MRESTFSSHDNDYEFRRALHTGLWDENRVLPRFIRGSLVCTRRTRVKTKLKSERERERRGLVN